MVILPMIPSLVLHIGLVGTSNVDGSWKRENNAPLHLTYSEGPGHAPGILRPNSTILDAFFCFLTIEVWDLLVQESNNYAARTAVPSIWYDTTVEEMQAFIGMLIIMGISKLPTVEMYWSVNYPDFANAIIRKIMPRSTFRLLFRFLYVIR